MQDSGRKNDSDPLRFASMAAKVFSTSASSAWQSESLLPTIRVTSLIRFSNLNYLSCLSPFSNSSRSLSGASHYPKHGPKFELPSQSPLSIRVTALHPIHLSLSIRVTAAHTSFCFIHPSHCSLHPSHFSLHPSNCSRYQSHCYIHPKPAYPSEPMFLSCPSHFNQSGPLLVLPGFKITF
jgi:hypothetical protein